MMEINEMQIKEYMLGIFDDCVNYADKFFRKEEISDYGEKTRIIKMLSRYNHLNKMKIIKKFDDISDYLNSSFSIFEFKVEDVEYIMVVSGAFNEYIQFFEEFELLDNKALILIGKDYTDFIGDNHRQELGLVILKSLGAIINNTLSDEFVTTTTACITISILTVLNYTEKDYELAFDDEKYGQELYRIAITNKPYLDKILRDIQQKEKGTV